MMIDSGIGKLQQIQQAQEQKAHNRAEIELYGRLYTFLRGIPGRSPAEHQALCNQIQALPRAGRRQFILEQYGQLCLERCEPMLIQLESLVQTTKNP